MKKFFVRCAAAGVIALTMMTAAFAGEIDLLLEKLVEKGVLSPGEAQAIATETKEEMRKEIAAAKSDVLPMWLQTMKLKGDFRVRYQWNKSKRQGSSKDEERHRGRVRLRTGVSAKVNEKLGVDFGLATGSSSGADNVRSTNQTFTDSWGKKSIYLDYAYATYDPFSWLTLVGGKMKIPFWEPGDLLWDTDITPEGGAIKITKDLASSLGGFINAGVFPIKESDSAGNNDDPVFYGVQSGIKWKASDTVNVTTALSYYDWSNIKGILPYGSAGGNTRTGGVYAYDYSTLTPALQIDIKEPLSALVLPSFMKVAHLRFFGEYVTNPSVDDNNSGWMGGFRFGAEKIEQFGDWQFTYNYARLEQEAIPDILPDSDRYGGKTGVKGHETALSYGLGKNTWLSLDYYYTKNIAASASQVSESLLQVDWNMKF